MEQILAPENLQAAYLKVKANKGAAGIDGIETEELGAHLRLHWEGIKAKLAAGTYQPAPARRVWLAKPGGGERPLSIANTVDRYIQQAVSQKLTPIFDPGFSEHSYGFRPRRNAHDAVRAARKYVHEGKTWVIDLDIKAFFDHVNHDILMRRLGQQVPDKTVLKLIGKTLRAGVREDRKTIAATAGIPQGGPLSPLLANIYLHPLDEELERRGLSFCRYADDVTIYASSERSARRIYESIVRWIEKTLRLEINRDKSQIRSPHEGSFLGFRIDEAGRIDLSQKSIERFKARVREAFDNQRQRKTSNEIRDQWKCYLQGWYGYFGICEHPWRMKNLSPWTRRHIRKLFWQRWHKSDGRRNALRRLGLSEKLVKLGACSRGAWRMSRHVVMQTALNNKVLKRYGFLVPMDLAEAANLEGTS